MSDRLRIELLGGFRAAFSAARPCLLPTRKAEALLAYLALPAGQFHSRDSLAALLWGNSSQAQARQSLRQALLSIRKLGARRSEPILLLRGTSVALHPELVSVDVADLHGALADKRLEVLERALQLYKGTFLDGFSLGEESFEEWRAVQSARLNELVLQASHELLRHQVRLNSVGAAVQTAMFVLALDPLHEAARRELMQLLWRQGRRAAALQQYQTCVALLHRDLGAEPEDETKQLYQEILRSRPRPGRSRRATTSAPALSHHHHEPVMRPPEVPLIGRAQELARLRSGHQQALDQGGRMMLVTGEAGIGKTRLLAELVRLSETSGVQLMIGRCHESERALPLHPWVEAIRGGATTLDPAIRETLAAATRGQLDRIFPELRERELQPVTSSEQSALLFDALFEIIGQLGLRQPTILLIEDLHWADEMSVRFVAYLARRIHRLPALFVASLRPEDVADAPAVAQVLNEMKAEELAAEMVIAPLARDESVELVQSLAGARRAASSVHRAADEIWAVSRGNPFIIIELAHEL